MSEQIPSGWLRTTLGQFLAFQRGHDLPERSRRPGEIPVIGSGGHTGWHDEAVAKGPGITVGRAANLGAPTLVPEDFWPLNTTLYVTDFLGNDVRFCFYLLKTLDLTGFNSGSVQPMLNRNYIRNFPVFVPYPPEQRAIAGVLGALDDKIAVNERIAATALELASAYHRASSAEAPSWRPSTFGEVADIYGGGTPRTSEPEYWNGEVAWTTPTDVTALTAPYLFDTAKKITQLGLANCASRLYPPGSIFMTSRATIGAFAVPQVPAAVNQGFIVVVPRETRDLWWLFHEMRSRVDDMIGLANGSTFMELSRKNFKAMPVRVPPHDVIDRFHEVAYPLHDRARAAMRENRTLAELRDTLLPRLMSGELRVKDVEV